MAYLSLKRRRARRVRSYIPPLAALEAVAAAVVTQYLLSQEVVR